MIELNDIIQNYPQITAGATVGLAFAGAIAVGYYGVYRPIQKYEARRRKREAEFWDGFFKDLNTVADIHENKKRRD